MSMKLKNLFNIINNEKINTFSKANLSNQALLFITTHKMRKFIL